MPQIFSVVIMVCIANALAPMMQSVAFAEDESASSGQASLAIVNAVSGDKNLFVSFDGQSIWPPGFTPGQSTASVMFPSGKKKLKVECEGYAPTEAVLDLPKGANCAVIFYPGNVAIEGPDKGKRKIGVFVPAPHLPGASAPKEIRFRIVSVGNSEPLELKVNGRKEIFLPSKSREISRSGQSLLRLEHQGVELFSTAPEEEGEYWVVIFPGSDGLSAVMLAHTPSELSPE